jgi:hypothetical protein
MNAAIHLPGYYCFIPSRKSLHACFHVSSLFWRFGFTKTRNLLLVNCYK